MFRPVKEIEWRQLQLAVGEPETIKRRSARLVMLLAEAFNDKTLGGIVGLKFTPSTDNLIVARVESEFGNARLKLFWALTGQGLVGDLRLEREAQDQSDQTIWEHVWGIAVPATGDLYVGTGQDVFMVPVHHDSGLIRNDAIFEFAMSVLFAIVNGPVKEYSAPRSVVKAA